MKETLVSLSYNYHPIGEGEKKVNSVEFVNLCEMMLIMVGLGWRDNQRQ